MKRTQGELKLILPTDFVTAGQDAFALVPFLAHFMGECKIKAVNWQVAAFPIPRSIIHIADAAAIKVLLLCVYLVGCL
jgi:hypothetical protein